MQPKSTKHCGSKAVYEKLSFTCFGLVIKGKNQFCEWFRRLMINPGPPGKNDHPGKELAPARPHEAKFLSGDQYFFLGPGAQSFINILISIP